MRKKMLLVIAIIVIVGVTLFAYSRSRRQQPDQAQQQSQGGRGGQRGQQGGRPGGNMPVPVAVAPATQQDLPVYLTGLGSVQAYKTVTVKSRVDGQVVNVSFREGQDVNEGQLLLQVDPRPFQVALEQAEATKYRDSSMLVIARRNAARYADLFEEGVVSQQDYDAQQSTLGQLEGTVRADQAQIDNAKLQITYSRVTAPISGRIGLRLVDPGNIVHAADANGVAVITQLHPIAVLFTLPEDSLPQVLTRLRDHKSLEVDVFSRDNQTKLSTGSLLTVNNQIDPSTGTVQLKGVFENKDSMLWPNQFVNARLLLDMKHNAIVIPAAAVQRGQQGTFTYVVKSDNTVEVRPIAVSLTEGNLVAVDKGLALGERVVTDGQDKLQAGSKVQPTNQQNPGQGRQQAAQIGAGQ